MTDAQALCGFKPPEEFGDPDYQCRHPARQDGLCLFHLLFKPTVGAIEEEFHQAFSKLLEDEEKNSEAELCDFRYFRFPAIDLSQRRFAKPLHLTGATFSGSADFERATFSGSADFGGATFSGSADFGGATFSKGARFWGATFSEGASFGIATFSEGASFLGATFSGKADFWRETFHDVCLFTGVTLDEKAEVIFEKANLTQASFLNTNLERIHFRDVKWPCEGRRQVLWDEFPHEGEQPDYEKVAENYRQLVLNYEAKRDFDTAEDFHIGEMEMRRKKKGKQAEDKAAKWLGMKMLSHWWGAIRERTDGYSIYKLSSNYGTSYGRGFLVLLMLLVLFSGIFLWSGLKPSKEHKDSLPINYELCLHTACQRASRQKVSDSASAFLFTLSLLTFQKERLYEPANRCTQFWVYIAVFLLAGQTALVLFAIRRRFKR